MRKIIKFLIIATVAALLTPCFAKAQFPTAPSKSPGLPSKTTPSPQAPQADIFATPQRDPVSYQAPVQATVVLRAPAVYQVQRQILVQAAPVAYATVAADPCVQQQVVQQTVLRNVVQHSAVVSHSIGAGVVHQAQVNHGLVGAAAMGGRAPRKIVTKQVTKQKRGLLGGLFGG